MEALYVKRIVYMILVTSYILFLCSGCQKKAGLMPTPQAGAAGATLNVMTSYGAQDGNRGNYQGVVKKFEGEYGVKINDQSEDSSEAWKNKVRDTFANDEEPDVLFFFTGRDAEELIQAGKFVDVSTIRQQYPSFASELSLNVLTNMQANDGQVYAVPVSGYWENMFIHSDLFEQYNVKVPKTWEEFLQAVQAFRAVGITPVAVSLKETPHYWFEFMIYNHTGPAGHQLSVPTDPLHIPEAWISGLQDLKTLYEAGAFPDDTNEMTQAEAFQMFQDKKAAMMIEGSWKTGTVKDDLDVRVVNVFAHDERKREPTDMMGGFSMGFYITKKAWDDETKRDWAVKFVSAMIARESVMAFNENGAASPIIFPNSEYDDPLLRSIATTQKNATAYVAAVQDTFSFGARNYLFSHISDIVTGKLDIQEALALFIRMNQTKDEENT